MSMAAFSRAPELGGELMPTKTAPSKRAPADQLWSERLQYFDSRCDAMVQSIRSFVEIESPSDNKPAANRMGAFLAGTFEALGGKAHLHRATDFGDNLQIDFPGTASAKPVMLLGHFDTVYPIG